MGRYDSHKNPFSYTLNSWAHRKTNNSREQEPKSMPGHVQEVAKDMLKIAYETKNSIMTLPVMKMSQSMSQFGRTPTQVGDMGMAQPGDYYMGGVNGFSGGGTSFYPRGNLSSQTFQHMSNENAPSRDYDTHWQTGGPTGWKAKAQEAQGGDSGGGDSGGGDSGGGGAAAAAAVRSSKVLWTGGMNSPAIRKMRQTNAIQPLVGLGEIGGIIGDVGGLVGGKAGKTLQQISQAIKLVQDIMKLTEISFDKNGMNLLRSVDDLHKLVIDGKNSSSTLCSKQETGLKAQQGKVYADPGQGKVYLGGTGPGGSSMPNTMSSAGGAAGGVGGIAGAAGGGGGGAGGAGGAGGQDSGQYFRVMTEKGISTNVYAKVG